MTVTPDPNRLAAGFIFAPLICSVILSAYVLATQGFAYAALTLIFGSIFGVVFAVGVGLPLYLTFGRRYGVTLTRVMIVGALSATLWHDLLIIVLLSHWPQVGNALDALISLAKGMAGLLLLGALGGLLFWRILWGTWSPSAAAKFGSRGVAR